MAEPVLALRGVGYRYPRSAAPALRDLGLEVAGGEFALLVGRSGSGKSTLLRAACGLVPHFHGGEFAGELRVAGRSIRDAGPAELAPAVGFVAQEPESQVVSTTVAAELELPLELRGEGVAECRRGAEEVALALGIEELLERTADSLSGGELQRVALAAALVTRPPLLLLDEPTSQLDPVGADELISLLRRLNEEWGVAVVLGEHRIERCLATADRVIALDGGALAFDGDPSAFAAWATAEAPWLAPAGARTFARAGRPERPATVKQARIALGAGPAAPPAGRTLPPPGPVPAGSEALSVRGLRVHLGSGDGRREAVRGAELAVARGERVALMGPNGAGKSSLLRAVAGLVDPSAGTVTAPVGCALLTQRPDDFLVRERIGEELPGAEGEAAMRAVGLDVAPDRDPRDLSGGERQRLAMAIALAGRGAGGTPPGLVCLDEPTRGLDGRRREDLAGWLGSLSAAGAAVVVATHDCEFAAAFAERVVLIARGEVIADGPAGEVLAGGFYFTTEVARITGGAAVTAEQGAAVLGGAPRSPARGPA